MVSDSHFGIKKANDIFFESQIKFFQDQFEPYLRKNKIDTIFFLGDVFDNRVSLNIKIKNMVLNLFSNTLKDYTIYVLVGNHDSYLSTNISINSLKFLDHLNNVKLIETETLIEYNKRKIYLSPWISNYKDFINKVSEMKERVDLCFGHFAINGFNLNKVKIEDGGLEQSVFAKFKKVFSGHFHIRGVRKNVIDNTEIIYVGSPYQLNRGDSNEMRGFCILDTETLDYKFIDNTESLQYVMLTYPEKFTEKMIKGNIIDVNVKFEKNTDDNKLQLYIKMIEKLKPIVPPQIIPINNFVSVDGEVDESIKSSAQLMREYINRLDVDNKEEIYSILEKLHEEASNQL